MTTCATWCWARWLLGYDGNWLGASDWHGGGSSNTDYPLNCAGWPSLEDWASLRASWYNGLVVLPDLHVFEMSRIE